MIRDDELACRAADGDELAFQLLVRRYTPLMVALVRLYFVPGMTRDDLMQEARIGLWTAAVDWNGSTPFWPFAKLVIGRLLLTALKTGQRQKHRPLWEARLEEDVAEFGTLADLVPGGVDPVERFEESTRFRAFLLAFARLSPLERDAALGLLADESYRTIAAALGVDERAVDNALQRVRRKVGAAVEAA